MLRGVSPGAGRDLPLAFFSSRMLRGVSPGAGGCLFVCICLLFVCLFVCLSDQLQKSLKMAHKRISNEVVKTRARCNNKVGRGLVALFHALSYGILRYISINPQLGDKSKGNIAAQAIPPGSPQSIATKDRHKGQLSPLRHCVSGRPCIPNQSEALPCRSSSAHEACSLLRIATVQWWDHKLGITGCGGCGAPRQRDRSQTFEL